MLLEQSLPVRQGAPGRQTGQPEAGPPPQSIPVSWPFFRPSLHAEAAQAPPVHTPSAQSEGWVQTPLVAHLGQPKPPQSTSVSLPFFTWSEQLAVAQAPPTHTWLAQSEPTAQTSPSPQLVQLGPPQSTSVSPLFLAWSVQVARQVEPEHLPPRQSEFALQLRAAAHFLQLPP